MFLTKKPMVKLLRRSFWTILSWVETLGVTESSWIQGGHPFGSISMGMMGKSMGKSTSISIAIVVFMGNQKNINGKSPYGSRASSILGSPQTRTQQRCQWSEASNYGPAKRMANSTRKSADSEISNYQKPFRK